MLVRVSGTDPVMITSERYFILFFGFNLFGLLIRPVYHK